jgi:hypothetical protein
MAAISVSFTGVGVVPPRKPVILGVFLTQVEGLLGQLHLDEQVAGVELARRRAALTLLHLEHALGRDEDLAENSVEVVLLDALEQRQPRLFSWPECVWTTYHFIDIERSVPVPQRSLVTRRSAR